MNNSKFDYVAWIGQFSLQPELQQLARFTQHGTTSCLMHSIAVAYFSLWLARKLGLHMREEEMARAALLHDYFLYDWHVKDKNRPSHARHHPYVALKNAERDFSVLTDVEKNIIRCHMFPLTFVPPHFREGWIVMISDRGCSLYETIRRKNAYPALLKLFDTEH